MLSPGFTVASVIALLVGLPSCIWNGFQLQKAWTGRGNGKKVPVWPIIRAISATALLVLCCILLLTLYRMTHNHSVATTQPQVQPNSSATKSSSEPSTMQPPPKTRTSAVSILNDATKHANRRPSAQDSDAPKLMSSAQNGGPQVTISPNASIQQHTDGDCSPAIVGNGNINNCAPQPILTASEQHQERWGNGWVTTFTITSNVLVQTGDLKLLCDGPVSRAIISRINPYEMSAGSNAPNPLNPDEAIYELGPEMLNPGVAVTVGVMSPNPVHVLSGVLGETKISFSK